MHTAVDGEEVKEFLRSLSPTASVEGVCAYLEINHKVPVIAFLVLMELYQ